LDNNTTNFKKSSTKKADKSNSKINKSKP